jgi:hypothetical protein
MMEASLDLKRSGVAMTFEKLNNNAINSKIDNT